jgi:phospholipid transport system substrate-binding protein
MNFFRSIIIAACMVISAPAFTEKASEPVKAAAVITHSAHEQVRNTTDRVMKIIEEAEQYFEKDPDRFFREVEEVLGDVVDFDSFARSVMGKYATSSRYKALKTTEQKSQFRARMERFSAVFKNGLVQTYAMGLLAFEGNKIEILPPKGEIKQGSSVTVVQHIYGRAEKPYIVHYKMRRNKAGLWKIRNVTIEAINLGKVYRSQFYSAAKQFGGDIDRVIDNWSVDPTKAQAEAG